MTGLTTSKRKKSLVTISIIVAAIAAVFVVFKVYPGQPSQVANAEGAVPLSGDPCGGTGGIGRIVSAGSGAFTIKRNDNGRNLTVNLSDQATVRTSAGSVSASDLKIGDRVTLAGKPNPDGSFTADTVAVCSGPGQGGQPGPRQGADANKYKTWNLYLGVSAVLIAGLVWLCAAVYLRLKKRKGFVYLLFFTVFSFYLAAVLYYTLFRFQSLLLLKYLTPGLMLNGVAAGKSLNLIPLVTLTLKDVRTSLLNTLLFMPFGFGLPFVTDLRMRRTVVTGALFSIGIELLQLVTGLIAKTTFRIADVNDVIFNTAGVVIGYLLFVAFMRMYRHISRNWKVSANPILQYIAERPQVD